MQNNRAVVTVSGVRDRLRVLLISGEPHAGERVWRSLLKADPSVDMVHFTILRPPDKQDATPLDELALIIFPTRELFGPKLDQFDLVIFDRYSERGILPLGYFVNIARYVDNGGALLVASGPEYAGPMSIYRTPLAAVLPAQPSSDVINQAYKPLVTAPGLAHPVTRDLPGGNTESAPPSWGRWFRTIGAEKVAGETLMSGANGRPLLVLDRVGKGRVAELLSDQAWLWARGFEGGGPQAELLRRLAHWLMKEPELEEERLSASIAGGELVAERRTMADAAKPVQLTYPDGRQVTLNLTKIEPGHWRASARGGPTRALSAHRRHAQRGDGGGAAQSEGSGRHARDGFHSRGACARHRRQRALADGWYAHDPPRGCRRDGVRPRLDRTEAQQRLSRDERGAAGIAAALAGAGAAARRAAAGVAAGGAVA